MEEGEKGERGMPRPHTGPLIVVLPTIRRYTNNQITPTLEASRGLIVSLCTTPVMNSSSELAASSSTEMTV